MALQKTKTNSLVTKKSCYSSKKICKKTKSELYTRKFKKGVKMQNKIRKRKEIMPTRVLGKIPSSGYVSNITFASEKELSDFVENEITFGPQIVSIPVPPHRHAFLIDIQPNKKKIMIADWNGKVDFENEEKEWFQYKDLLQKIKNKFTFPIEYYPIHKKIHENAKQHNEKCEGGGCSFYIYEWVKLKYPEYC